MLRGLAVSLLLTFCGFAQQSPPVLRGSWTATAGPKQVFRGKWSGQVVSTTPNAAHGSWVLLNAANQIVLEGTWSAEKSPRGWEGRWSARIATGRSASSRSPSGKSFSGTWQAEIKDSKTKTLVEMLQRTLEDQVTGAWRSGRLGGNWWLKGSSE